MIRQAFPSCFLILPLVLGGVAHATVVTFEDSGIPLPTNNANVGPFDVPTPAVGSSATTQVTLSGLTLNNTVTNDPTFGISWAGFGLSSNTNDTGNFYFEDENDLSVSDGGQGGSDTWAVAFSDFARMSVAPGGTIDSLFVRVPDPVLDAIEQGVFGSTPFGGTSPDQQFGVRFLGDGGGSVDVTLADWDLGSATLTAADRWTLVDLTPLSASTIDLEFFGTDTSEFAGQTFLNTPTYVAIDTVSITAIPEPSTFATLGMAAVLFPRRRRRR